MYRHVLVSEVDDGYVARGFHGRRATLAADGLALPLDDVVALIASHERERGGQMAERTP